MNSRSDRVGLVAIMVAAVAMTVGGVAYAVTDAGVHGPGPSELPLIVQTSPEGTSTASTSTQTDTGGDTDHEIVNGSVRESGTGDGDIDGQSGAIETTPTATGR